MKRIIPLAFLLIASPVQAQTVKWFSGQETGDFSELATNSGCATLTAANAFTGAYAWQCTNGGAGSFVKTPTGFSASPVGVRMRLNPGSLPGGHIQNMAQIINAADTKFFSVFITAANKLAWGHNNNTAIATGGTTLTTATFHLVEINCVISASVGGCEVKLDGNTEFTSFGTDTSDISSVDHVYFVVSTSAGSDVLVWDDVMVCSGGYCPAGRTIARQGTSATPTYNAWTKAGTCSGGNISTCWSATPFSTAASATSAVAADAQTMLVSPFNATQTGHGTEVLNIHDTVNACKTAGIIKSGTAAAPLSLRRRINGTDTDTAKTLTTSDAYYDDGIWTTSGDNLSNHTPEIGVLHGTGVATDTVEDMWLICDYLAVTVPTRHRVTQ